MNTVLHQLQIHIHKTDSSSEMFVQNEEGPIKHILREFQPDCIFNRDRIVIVGRHSLTCLPVSRLARMDLVSEQLTDWIFPPNLVNAVELSEMEFRALVRNPELRDQWNQTHPQDVSVIIFLEVEMAGQAPVFLVMEIASKESGNQLDTLSAVFSGRALCFRMRNGGVAALNLAHLTRVTLFPGSSQAPLEAWPAERSQNSRLKEFTRTLNHLGEPPSAAQAVGTAAG
ncbi:MAG TPA: hypothetical protein VMA35_16060 [Candidatus Sulfopaludibacter sp.]|nr:hypothetical protein [Candidatus Sulfopaludibacter sp.]